MIGKRRKRTVKEETRETEDDEDEYEVDEGLDEDEE